MTTSVDESQSAYADRITARVGELLAGVDRLGVAFSGGVDSSVLLALAARSLGRDRVVAVLGVSASLAADERTAAHEVARHIGVPVVEIATREGERAGYAANGPDRCFHCRDELFTRIDDEVLAAHRLDAIAYGENTDDAEETTACCTLANARGHATLTFGSRVARDDFLTNRTEPCGDSVAVVRKSVSWSAFEPRKLAS